MPVMPRIVMTQAEFEETYPQALALLCKYFGPHNITQPRIGNLAERRSGRVNRSIDDFFIIDEAALKARYPNVLTANFLDTLQGGDGQTEQRVGGSLEKLELVNENRTNETYIQIDALSLVAAIRKGKDFRNGKSVGEIFDEALTPPTLMAGTVVRQPGDGDHAVLKVRDWQALMAARKDRGSQNPEKAINQKK